MDLIITDQVEFTSYLLANNDVHTVQHTLQNCLIVVNDITTLEHILDKLYFAVMAGLYNNGIQFANICRNQFDIYKNQLQKHHIKKLYDRYNDILKIIRSKLLEEFDTTKQDKLNNQLIYANDLIELLGEADRNKFLQDLSLKICIDIPKGKFIEHNIEQLQWIHSILEDNTKYKILDKWNLKKFIIDTWANKIKELVTEDGIPKLNVKLLNAVKQSEQSLTKYYGETNDLLTISFDTFCSAKLQEQTNQFKLPEMNMNVDNNMYQSTIDLLIALKEFDKKITPIINKRNIQTLVSFYESKINEYLDIFGQYYKDNFIQFFTNDHVMNTKNTFEYITKTVQGLKDKYNNCTMKNLKIEHTKKEINNMIYNKYKEKCYVLIDNVFNKFYINKLKTFIGNVTNINKNTDNDTSIQHGLTDTSSEINDIIAILNFTINIDSTITMYLLGEINQYYKIKTDVESLMKYNDKIYNQIAMDLCCLRDTFKIYTLNMFTEVINKIKFLQSDIHSNEIFVEQFKMFNKNHNGELLKKILKLKCVDQVKSVNILKIYEKKEK